MICSLYQLMELFGEVTLTCFTEIEWVYFIWSN